MVMLANVLAMAVTSLGAALAMGSPQAAASSSPDACTPSPLALQVVLDRAGFSPGEIDGQIGPRTRRALEAFHVARHLDVTGRGDCGTWQALEGPQIEPLVEYTIRPEDVAGPFLDGVPGDLMEQSKLASLSYTAPVEALGEHFHASPRLLAAINAEAAFLAGETILVPNVIVAPLTHRPPPIRDSPDHNPSEAHDRAADHLVIVSNATSSLRVETPDGEVMAYAPVTVGSEHDPLPIGVWKVTTVRFEPEFFYNPDLFWDADPLHSKARIAAGPNNPVGLVWIGITREHYGLHGTPEPARIGWTESHGCVRMTNWDALRIARLVGPGTVVRFE